MKERLDVLLVQQGFFETRERAKRAIMAGVVIVDNKKIEKAGTAIKWFDELPEIRIKGEVLKYVSRGGLKLEKAIKLWNLDFSGKKILDVGASTGGFTDCALQNGAVFAYSMDVGTNQLDWKLRNHEQVKSIEGTHIKNLTLEEIDNSEIDFIVMDVSFISITKVIPHLIKFMNKNTKLMALIKPQFEVGRENIEKGGIVKNPKKHKMAIEMVVESAAEYGLKLHQLDFSPITGGKGNIEYISLFSLVDAKNTVDIDKVVEESRILK
ncbi:MAG: TlyA family rRNA (cytidine-2'-O)-methyltransferase [Fusobacteriia bacterium 4572_74]|nr:MAG: TlyA family rRNA (cytidine-2'-O)-methyltransferase [Fusobacteriia bacterium 4572_74]